MKSMIRMLLPRGAVKSAPICEQLKAIREIIDFETEMQNRYAQALTKVYDDSARLGVVRNQSIYYRNSSKKDYELE